MSDQSPVEFAPWPTPVENHRLELVDLRYRGRGAVVELPPEQLRLEVHPGREPDGPELTADFLNLDTQEVLRVSVSSCIAFRVLDEHGLTELWAATHEQGARPGNTTFKVRNHGWASESELSFFHGASDGFSYLIATAWACLEIICDEAPQVTTIGTAMVSRLDGTVH